MPILTSIISQVTPSESSLIKRIGMEPMFLNFLRDTLGIKGVKRVSMHEPLTNIRKVIALVVERDMPTTEIWRALYGAGVLHRAAGKYVIAVNDDIDPENADALLWAMSYRANAAARHAHPAASRPGPRPAQQAQWRRGRLGADRRDAEGEFPADLAAEARIHGAREEDLGGARPARRSSRSRRGSAIRSANGPTSSTPPPQRATAGDYFAAGQQAGQAPPQATCE